MKMLFGFAQCILGHSNKLFKAIAVLLFFLL